ncbi:hypothetical protein [Streptomyces sp. NPDC055642]
MNSSISVPSIVATQLEQLDAQPGHKVLEAEAATGYNAALLGKIVSPSGKVWTLDVDQDLVAGAGKHLAEAGVDNATAILADGAAGLPEHAPYDRIIFTGAGDVPVRSLHQLAPGGRLVLPMRVLGIRSKPSRWADAKTGKNLRGVVGRDHLRAHAAESARRPDRVLPVTDASYGTFPPGHRAPVPRRTASHPGSPVTTACAGGCSPDPQSPASRSAGVTLTRRIPAPAAPAG